MSDNEDFDANVELSEVESPKEPRKKKTCSELFQHISDLNTQMEELDNEFMETEKSFEKDRKEYISMRKRLRKELVQTLKKCTKRLDSELSKANKSIPSLAIGNVTLPVPHPNSNTGPALKIDSCT